jgi:Leucine-rich repeat (LRR) protein
MIRIEGEFDQENDDLVEQSSKQNSEDDPEEDETNQNEDELHDNFAKGFMKDMNKVGPFSKQIMSYSYPPLLYQRGDDSDEEFGGEEDEEESDSAGVYNLDGEDGFNMENLMGQDLDDLDQNNADLKQQEEIIDGLFA